MTTQDEHFRETYELPAQEAAQRWRPQTPWEKFGYSSQEEMLEEVKQAERRQKRAAWLGLGLRSAIRVGEWVLAVELIHLLGII